MKVQQASARSLDSAILPLWICCAQILRAGDVGSSALISFAAPNCELGNWCAASCCYRARYFRDGQCGFAADDVLQRDGNSGAAVLDTRTGRVVLTPHGL